MKLSPRFMIAVITLFLAVQIAAQEKTPEKQGQFQKFNIYVMDFTSIDMEGHKRFLDVRNRPIVIPDQCTLNDKDRVSVNTVMQGVVRTTDAVDHSRTNQVNRDAQVTDNQFDRVKALGIYNATVNGPTRPLVIGAQYFTAFLGEHPDVFQASNNGNPVSIAMAKISAMPEFPKDCMLALSRETGLTHLVYGTVSDIRTTEKTFQGYNISTKNVVYEMDVILSMIDLVAQRGVYGKVYTGRYSEALSPAGNTINRNIYETLMTSALRQAADDFYAVCKPGPDNKVKVTPLGDAPQVNLAPAIPAKPVEQPAEKPENLPRPAPETAGPAIIGAPPVVIGGGAVAPAVLPVVIVPEAIPKEGKK